MKRTVGAMLVAAGLLSSFQVAEAAPDADVMACAMSVRKTPAKVGNTITTSGASSGCQPGDRFIVVLEVKRGLGWWVEVNRDTWNHNDRKEASTPCESTRRTYRGYVKKVGTDQEERSGEASFAC